MTRIPNIQSPQLYVAQRYNCACRFGRLRGSTQAVIAPVRARPVVVQVPGAKTNVIMGG